MSTWHPATKITTVVGALAIVVLLLTGESEPGASAVASLPRSADTVVAEQVDKLNVPPRSTAIPDKTSLKAMVERPLFASTRRPAEIEVEDVEIDMPEVEIAQPQTMIPEPEMSYVGSLVRDDTILALVTRGNYGAVESIGVGEEIDGWKVLEIGDRAISLGLEDRILEYRIFD